MSSWERDLPPIARDRLARIGEPTREEIEKMRESEKVDSLLSEFYQGQTNPESLWRKLKEEGKPSLLKEVQVRMVDSLGFGTSSAQLQKRRDGVLAIESLKKERNTSMVELNFRRMEDLQKRYKAEIEQAYDGIRVEVERNPRLRMKQVQQGQNAVVVQLTVDEAVKQLPQWREFLANQERRYSQEFAGAVEKLKRELE